MFKSLKKENGYIEGLFTCIIFILIIGFMLVSFIGNLCFDFESGSHRITPTAIDRDMFGNYKVYYKTSQYTQNQEEDYYYIQKEDTKLAEQMQEYIAEGKEVIVYYDEWVGFKGFTSPSESPIIRIEEINN